MRLLVLNKTQADKVRGVWKNLHKIIPVEVVANKWYLLNIDAIIRIKPQLKSPKFKDLRENLVWFTVGDGSTIDLKYQTWLASQQDEI